MFQMILYFGAEKKREKWETKRICSLMGLMSLLVMRKGLHHVITQKQLLAPGKGHWR